MASRIVRVAGEALQLTGAMRTARRGLVDHAHAIRAFALRLGSGSRLGLMELVNQLYKHEYAHYMRYNMPVPKQYQWQPGIHGSAWKYCCSLIGAAPTPYYKAGEALMNHNYEKTLRNPIHDKTVAIRDQHRREQEYRRTQNVIIKYETGEKIKHPKFGEGIIEKIEKQTGSVTLHIRFGDAVKVIDQKWLLQTKYKKGRIQKP